uniref:Ig-like domain-containing protein n=1 Tax=Astatotilapia calliptera TaxID=8154 RepID=A0AAX7VTM1_ASTCA
LNLYIYKISFAFSVCVGKDATLSCTIVGSPTPLITWEKDKLKLTSGGRFKTVEDGDAYRLTIYDLTLEDSGQYMCRAKNSVGEAYAAVTLKVALPTEMSQKAPVFMVKPASARVVLGGDVVFHCQVAAYPEANFEWEKDGRYLGETSRIKIISESDGSTLKIQCVRNLDSGTYTCRAQNTCDSFVYFNSYKLRAVLTGNCNYSSESSGCCCFKVLCCSYFLLAMSSSQLLRWSLTQ